jgi:hypothetical protein
MRKQVVFLGGSTAAGVGMSHAPLKNGKETGKGSLTELPRFVQ